MKYLRWLLFPFSLVYGLVVIIRNFCYDAGILKSYKFNKPIISVGNLDVGGAGKSPMTEYLIGLLKEEYQLATLSRGYGRRTKGYLVGEVESRIMNQEPIHDAESVLMAAQPSTLGTHNSQLTPHRSPLTAAQLIGDEPAQFKQKFPTITVAVCEDRVAGITRLIPDHDLIILDDAYQHRAVEPGFSILLFDYNRINDPHLLLPAGNMREPFSGRWRAHIVVITKCLRQISNDEQLALAARIKPLPYQVLFFSSINYEGFQDLQGKQSALQINPDTTVFLLTGISNANPLVRYLKSKTTNVIHHKYPDHHPFTLKNIVKLADEFAACSSPEKIIVTTEKDAQRLNGLMFKEMLQGLPLFVIPIKVRFLNNSEDQFNRLVIEYVRKHTTGHALP